jgi:Tfp pilus assembly pilus retraction ATPase PilT
VHIGDLSFIDLYLGDQFCDITGYNGVAGRAPVPPYLEGDISELRAACKMQHAEVGDDEFSLTVDSHVYRVSAYRDVDGRQVFALRRSAACLRPLNSLGFGAPLLGILMAREQRGLVLICGEMASGKTSTAASVVVERLKRYGGVCMAIEDPPETALNGIQGQGRCIQVPVTRRTGYKEMLARAMRSGAGMILVGEIRDEETAIEVLRASINGHYIIATIHAGSVVQGIERLQTLCLARSPNTNAILADGLAAVVWQSRETVPGRQGQGSVGGTRVRAEFLLVHDQPTVKARIKNGAIASLEQDAKEQSARLAWAAANNTKGG